MKEFIEKCWERAYILLRMVGLPCVLGVILGLVGGLFGRSITLVTAFRQSHPWMLYLLPLAGLGVVALYRMDPYRTSTNLVLEGVQEGKYVPLRMAPLIVVSTVLTHAFGGSAGREGAALQLGGSIGGTMGKLFRMSEYDRKLFIICSMSAAFSALFGTPLTAAIFSMEVISVGIMHYAALVPCAVAALVAREMAILVGAPGEHFIIRQMEPWNLSNAALTVLLAILCAAVSILFCATLHYSERILKRLIPNDWLRAVWGGVMLIFLTLLLGTADYLGAGMQVVERAMEGEAHAAAFLLKIAFTAITLGAGFKGGEIVPTLFVGATFGCLFGQLVGFSPSLAAACGLAAVFCGVTNCPISSLLLSFELFGFEGMPFFLLSVGISYLESGYFGLYHSQKILYSKTRFEFINRHTK